jgi:hypothetical protein
MHSCDRGDSGKEEGRAEDKDGSDGSEVKRVTGGQQW